MVIAFDTWILSSRCRHQGYYVYSLRLLQEFQRLLLTSTSVTVRPFVSPGLDNDANGFATGHGFRPVNSALLSLQRVWRCGGASVAALGAEADLLFSPTPQIIPLGLVPVVVTIADVTPTKLPSHLLVMNSVLRIFTSVAARFSQKIVTISECSKKDLVELYGVPPEKVIVTYCGYHQELFNLTPPDEAALGLLLSRFNIRRPYIFHHGTVQPRKNLQRLIEAHGKVMERNRDLDVRLVLAGSFGWQYEPIVRAGATPAGRGKVIFTGALQDRDLALLLKGSAACVIPSLYEGFCLPMVEAMACGIPTVTSNNSCLPEVSGNVLRYFDPLSVEDMANVIELVLCDSQVRQQLAADGIKRASFFSWEKCARETLNVLTSTYAELTGEVCDQWGTA